MRFLDWLFGKEEDSARSHARDRMRRMVIHDRLELPADRVSSLEEELVAVVSRYFEIDRDTTRFDLQQYERKASLVANFPLLRSKC